MAKISRTSAVTKMLGASKSKYRAIRTTVDGVKFSSKKEAARYGELKLLLKRGDIRELRLQPRYVLCALTIDMADLRNVNAGVVSPRRVPVCVYVADFEYEESDRGWGGVNWTRVVEDTKGFRTDVYKIKKKLFEAQYGIQIREV